MLESIGIDPTSSAPVSSVFVARGDRGIVKEWSYRSASRKKLVPNPETSSELV